MRAIEHGCRVQDWQENMVPDEVPPRWMWHLDHELKEWFENLEWERKNRYSNRDDDDEVIGLPVKNELSRGKA